MPDSTPAPSSTRPLVSVIVPAYEEEATVAEVVRRVCQQPFSKEVIVVDDGSRDGTAAAAAEAAADYPEVRVHQNLVNVGKGSAVRVGYALARGEILAIQDADLELDPADLTRLVSRFEDPAVQAVYGSRFARAGYRCTLAQRLANKALSLMTSALYGQRLTDMETCYKLFRREVIEAIRLESTRFEFEPEVTAKVLRLGVTIVEEPISYQARSKLEGKKIGVKDGLQAVSTLIRWRLADSGKFLR